MRSRTRTYLDYAASAPVAPAARRAFLRAERFYANPGSPHEEGRAARTVLESARKTVAELTGAKAEHITFTGSATEANALALEGAVRAAVLRGANIADIHLLFVEGAHASVAQTMEKLKAAGAQVETLPLSGGALSIPALMERVRKETLLISLEAVNGETGLMLDTKEVKRRAPHALVHVDASQAPLIEPVERERYGADLMTLDAQKIGGIRGVGALIRSSGVHLAPIIEGGGQEGGLRSGTPAPALISAFAAALQDSLRHRTAFLQSAAVLRKELIARTLRDVPDALVNEGKKQAPHIVNLSFPGRDTDYLLALLDEHGFAVSTRSACELDATEGSRAVFALTGDRERSRATIRISFGPATRARDLERFSRALSACVRFLDQSNKGGYTTR